MVKTSQFSDYIIVELLILTFQKILTFFQKFVCILLDFLYFCTFRDENSGFLHKTVVEAPFSQKCKPERQKRQIFVRKVLSTTILCKKPLFSSRNVQKFQKSSNIQTTPVANNIYSEIISQLHLLIVILTRILTQYGNHQPPNIKKK